MRQEKRSQSTFDEQQNRTKREVTKNKQKLMPHVNINMYFM